MVKRSALPLIYWQYISIHSNPVKCHSEKICMLLDAFIATELSSAVNGNNNAELLSCFQNTLDKMCNTLTFIDHTVTEQSGQVAMLDFSAK